MTMQPISPMRRTAAPRLGITGSGGIAAVLRRIHDALLPGLPIVRYDMQRRMLLLPERAGRGMRPAKDVARREAVELHVPAAAALRKTVRLPAAARENLAAVLALEMDRETPFSADSVWFTWRIAARDRASLTIDLLVIPRALFEECRDALAGHGMAARRIAVEQPDGGESVRFPVRAGAAARRFVPATSLLLLGLALGLSVTALDLRQDWALRERLAEVRAQAEQAQALRRSLEVPAGEGEGELPSRVALLAALADALPDGTWLDRLSIDGRTVELSGFAPDAAALLVRLGQLPRFRDVRFLGATVRDGKLQREHFQIALSIADGAP